jgi:hypothetical protein
MLEDGFLADAQDLGWSSERCTSKSRSACGFVGTSAEATAAFRAETDFILASSKAAGVRFVHCTIWRDLPEASTKATV